METLATRAQHAALLHGSVIGTWLVFKLARRLDPRMKKATKTFEATYQFRSGSAVRRLIFTGGRVTTRRGAVADPDYELVLLDPPAVIRQLAEDPNDVLRLLMDNKVRQRGNMYYLFRYGYLWGLCRRYATELAGRFERKRSRLAG